MKTQNSILIALLVLFMGTTKLNAQTWAPIGATWHYTKSYDYPPYLISYIKITSEKDTTINAINCRKLIKHKPGIIGTPGTYKEALYMYESDHKVYYYVDSLHRFCLLYNFNANAGDWWILDEFPASWGDTVKVISTDYININGQQKKTMQLTNTCIRYDFVGTTIEDIGNWYYMFPSFGLGYDGPLRCYQDNTLGIYNTGASYNCEATTIGIEEYTDNGSVSVFPNPADKIINIIMENNTKNVGISIINSKGQVLRNTKTAKEFETLDVAELPSGMYIVQLLFEDKIISRKIQLSK